MPHVHVFNGHATNAHVFIAEKSSFMLLNILLALDPVTKDRDAFKNVSKENKLSDKFDDVADLYQTLVVAAETINDASATTAQIDGAKRFVQAFKEFSFEIAPSTVMDVKATKGLSTLKPTAIKAALGSATLNLIIMTDDGGKVVMFDTNHDHSWIVTDPAVVRAKYGHLFFPDPNLGQHPWKGTKSYEKKIAEHGGFLWRVTNDTGEDLSFYPRFTSATGNRLHMHNIINKTGGIVDGAGPDHSAGFNDDKYCSMTDGGKDGSLEPATRLKLNAEKTNGWGEAWEDPSQKDHASFRMAIFCRQSARGEGPTSFLIPSKFMHGSEITAVIRARFTDSIVRIDLPGSPRETIPWSHDPQDSW